jgi:hypothetical protein
MKKAVSLLVALALFATTAFAAPVSVASLPEPAQTVTSSASTDIEALFADVAAVPLTDEEAAVVEGEGVFGLLVAAVVNYYVLPKIQASIYSSQVANYGHDRALTNSIGFTAIAGSAIMAIGAILPF